jgi:hypothetical protein
MNVLLSTACWPNLHYFYHLLHADNVQIEQHENYQKQSFRNRYQILSANGVLDLSIPVENRAIKMPINEVYIDYKENWQIRHWRALTSAYKNSPYFDFFESDIQNFFTVKHERLFDYNLEQLKLIFKLLQLKKDFTLTAAYENETSELTDFRGTIHPKKEIPKNDPALNVLTKPYYQTFGDKFGFVPNLCILDLIFNAGLNTKAYLKTESSSD